MAWKIVPAAQTEALFGVICPHAAAGTRAHLWREQGWTVWVYGYDKTQRTRWPAYRAPFVYWLRRERDHAEWAAGAPLLREAKAAGLAKLATLKVPDPAPAPKLW